MRSDFKRVPVYSKSAEIVLNSRRFWAIYVRQDGIFSSASLTLKTKHIWRNIKMRMKNKCTVDFLSLLRFFFSLLVFIVLVFLSLYHFLNFGRSVFCCFIIYFCCLISVLYKEVGKKSNKCKDDTFWARNMYCTTIAEMERLETWLGLVVWDSWTYKSLTHSLLICMII